uniref:Myosin heavy chain, pectoralis profundus (Fragments) n=1 Tax=Gallus gallus TaxID=9031 RepID=Q7LZL0_CHICK
EVTERAEDEEEINAELTAKLEQQVDDLEGSLEQEKELQARIEELEEEIEAERTSRAKMEIDDLASNIESDEQNQRMINDLNTQRARLQTETGEY